MRLKLFFSALAVAAIALTGCNKQTELEINYGKTATLQGKVTIFDKDNSTSQVASKVKVYAEVSYADMITTSTTGTPAGKKTFETTTDENGVYSFEIPVTDKQSTGIKLYTELKEIEGKFYIGEVTNNTFAFNTTQGAITYQNINMFSENMAETVITVKGTVEISGTNATPAKGFEVTTTVGSKEYKTTTNSDGEYVFQLPYIATRSLNINVPAQEVGEKTYRGNYTTITIYANKLEYEISSAISVTEQ